MSLGGIVLGGLILEFAIWAADAFCEKKSFHEFGLESTTVSETVSC